MTRNNLDKSIFVSSPIGYSYNKIIYDDNNNLKDFEFVEVNKSFESMVGLKAEELLGKRFSKIVEDTEDKNFSWNAFYIFVIENYKNKDSQQYFDSINNKYSVEIRKPKKNHIMMYFTDVSQEQREVENSKKISENVSSNARYSIDSSINATEEETIEHFISNENNGIKERILYSSLDFTHELLTNDNHYDALSNGIEMLGNATQVDRVYYWENHYDNNLEKWVTSQKFEWVLGTIDQQIDNPNLQNIPFEEVGDFIGTLSLNKTFSAHVKDLDEKRTRTREILEGQDILSILVIPVFVKDEFRGFIGFDSCTVEKEWTQVEISLLSSFVLLYVKAVERDFLEKRVTQERENFLNYFNMIEDLLFVLDFEGNIIDVNNAVLKRLDYSRRELLGQPVSILHPKDKVDEVTQNIELLIKGEIDTCDILAITKNKVIVPVVTRITEGIWNGEKVLFAVSKDMTELTLSEEKFSKAFNNSGVSMVISRYDDGIILEANNIFLDYVGYKKQDIIGKSILDLNIIDYKKSRNDFKNEIATNGKIVDREIEILRKDNKIRTGLINIVPLTINNELYLLSSIIDITERILYEEKILELSNRDSLVGVYNRRFVYERAKELIEEYKRHGNIFSVGMIDIDDFKAINDEFGHQVGDSVLKQFSRIMEENLRVYDILGRYGGEEFIVILNHSSREESNLVLERILNMVKIKPFVCAGNEISFTFSTGIASSEELEKDEITMDKLVAIADKRLFEAKKDGKNKIVYK